MATDADIKKAYRKESLKHHPDKVRFTSYFDDPLLTSNLGWRPREIQARGRGECGPIGPREKNEVLRSIMITPSP
jgi:hypothetical protein